MCVQYRVLYPNMPLYLSGQLESAISRNIAVEEKKRQESNIKGDDPELPSVLRRRRKIIEHSP